MGQMQNVNDLDEIQHPGLLIGAKGIDRSDGLKMADLLNKISSSIMEIYNRSVVVTCFSKSCYTSGPIDASHASFGNKVLWGTYADNLAGAAVVFDPDLLSKQIHSYFQENGNNYKIWSEDIDYTDGPRSRAYIHSFPVEAKVFEDADEEEFVARAHGVAAQHVEPLLFNKRAIWASENEWRIAAITPKQGPHFIPYGDALKAVVIGPRTPIHPSIIAKGVDFPVYSLGKAGNRPELDLLGPF